MPEFPSMKGPVTYSRGLYKKLNRSQYFPIRLSYFHRTTNLSIPGTNLGMWAIQDNFGNYIYNLSTLISGGRRKRAYWVLRGVQASSEVASNMLSPGWLPTIGRNRHSQHPSIPAWYRGLLSGTDSWPTGWENVLPADLPHGIQSFWLPGLFYWSFNLLESWSGSASNVA